MEKSLVGVFLGAVLCVQQMPQPLLSETQAVSRFRTVLETLFGNQFAAEVQVQPNPQSGQSNGGNGTYEFQVPRQGNWNSDSILVAGIDAYTGNLLTYLSDVPSAYLAVTNPTSPSSWLEAGNRCRQLTNTPEVIAVKHGRPSGLTNDTYEETLVEFHRLRNGVRLPIESEASIHITNSNGLIYLFRFPPTPDLDPLPIPINLNLAQARTMAAARASVDLGGSCVESSLYPVALSYYYEEDWPFLYENFPDYFYLCKTTRPKLGYVGIFEDGAAEPEHIAWIAVIPDTGEILCEVKYTRAGTFGGPSNTKKLPMLWDWELGPIRVLSGKRFVSISKGRIDLASSAKALKSDGEVVLQRARLNVLCQMNKAAGLIWHEYKGKRIYGRPDPETRRAIGQLLQKKISRKERKQP